MTAKRCSYAASHKKRVPVPPEVRRACMALHVERGYRSFQLVGVGQMTWDDLCMPGGTVQPDVLERVKAKLAEVTT